MHLICVTLRFSAAHKLELHPGKCSRLHGHTWKAGAVIYGETLADDGMLLDFEELKSMLRAATSDLDHAYLNELESFREIQPTAENVARLIFQRLKGLLEVHENVNGVRLASVFVQESPDTYAIYNEGSNLFLIPE